MSINNKLRTLARLLPYYPRMDSKGKLIVTNKIVSGTELLKEDNYAVDGNGKKITSGKNYKQPIVMCADHFEELKKAWKLNGEEGVRQYSEKVKAYDEQQKGKK